ncbi:hypothetical protein LQZ19_06225 [Treponema primitia]|uniref:hypothetical protein n=1 Tax=Treponema primitia TaxID=88058 RepID=UPI00397FBC99
MFKSINGFYQPSFFYMNLDTDKLLTEIYDTDDESTFIHEYIHMLQDISLICTRAMLWQNVNNFRAFSKEIRDNGNGNRPIRLTSKNDMVNEKLYAYLWGEYSFFDSAIIENIEIKETDLGDGIKTKEIILYLIENNGNRSIYKIGRRDFLECMAFMIENYIFPSVVLPDFPYKSIWKILEYYKIPVSNYIVSQVCELALSSYHPVEALLIFLDRTNKKLQTNDIFDAMYGNIVVKNYDGTFTNKINNDKKAFAESKHMMQDWFKSPIVANIGDWLTKILELGENFRISDCVYISNIINNSKEDARKLIFQHVVTTGVPVIFNRQHIAQCIDPTKTNGNTFLLIALDELYSYCKDTRSYCNLINFCKKSNEQLVNTNCCCDVMKQIEGNRLCPIGVWLKVFGFQNLK